MIKCEVGNLFKKKLTIKLKQQTAQNRKTQNIKNVYSAHTAHAKPKKI